MLVHIAIADLIKRHVSAAAVIILRRKKFIRRFTERGATTPDRAVPFAEVGMRRSWIFDQMVDRGVFVNVGHDRFYMDEQRARAFLDAQRRRAWIAAVILLIFFLLFLVGSSLW
jgi:hypothetical protein